MPRLVVIAIAIGASALTLPSRVAAQRMDLALSRLRVTADSSPGSLCSPTFDGGMRDFCGDDDAWRRLATQFAGSLAPPLISPARTRGPRGLYVGLESFITGIDSGQSYWHRGVEGDSADAVSCGSGDPGMNCQQSRFVDSVLAWNRLSFRKGLPLGFELGTSVGFLTNTSYWTLGVEVRWALFEGFRDSGLEFLPDITVRGAVQTMVGDPEMNVTVPAIDVTLSKPIVLGSVVELSPFGALQLAWTFADTELVDLTPERDAFAECDPDPAGAATGGGSPPYCRRDGTDYNHNRVFPRLRSMRVRAAAGLQLRYEWFTIAGSFSGDLVSPNELDRSLPGDLPHQWQVDVAVGLSY